ncbi:uncharacterized protein LOC134823107 [Bolinopsis microptera]|uniref:uncharacterized protein LOC134823107 n=1 Tax=Bolinopsis microptera TaxID=2820187 RepID=UPI00307AE30B
MEHVSHLIIKWQEGNFAPELIPRKDVLDKDIQLSKIVQVRWHGTLHMGKILSVAYNKKMGQAYLKDILKETEEEEVEEEEAVVEMEEMEPYRMEIEDHLSQESTQLTTLGNRSIIDDLDDDLFQTVQEVILPPASQRTEVYEAPAPAPVQNWRNIGKSIGYSLLYLVY